MEMGVNLQNLCQKNIIGARTQEQIVTERQCASLVRCGIRVLGMSLADETFEFVRLEPAMSQVLVCQSGKGQVLVENRWVDCTPGWAYITPENMLHGYHAVSGEPWQVFWVIYHGGASTSPLRTVEAPALVPVDVSSFAHAMEGLLYEAGHLANEAMLNHWAELVHLQNMRVVGGGVKDLRLMDVWGTVQKDLAREWSLKDFADQAHMSKQQFYRLCVQAYGLSPMRRLRQLRILRAADLLLYTDYPIKSIGYQVGYQDPYAFSTAFRRVMGVAPSHYRGAN